MTGAFAQLWRRLQYVLRRNRLDAELLDELETHRALRQQQLERGGLAPSAAVAASRQAMGNVLLAREDARAVWLGSAFALRRDLNAGIRLLRRYRITSLAIVTTMALAIATTAVVAAIFDASVRRPLPYPHADRLVWVTNHHDRFGSDTLAARGDVEIWRPRVPAFERLGVYGLLTATLDAGGRVTREPVATFGADMWPLLGVHPAHGRLFGPGDRDVVVITHTLFERLSGVPARVIGVPIELDGRRMTVIGVLPRGPAFLLPGMDHVAATAYLPLPSTLPPPGAQDRAAAGGGPVADWVRVIARLRSAATLDEARAQFATVHAAIARQYPSPLRERSPRITPLHDKIAGPTAGPLRLLLIAVVCLLTMAATNVAVLLVTQVGSRRSELAVRVSLGAGIGGIFRQLLAEGVVLAGLATAAGLVISRWLLTAVATVWPQAAPRATDAVIDQSVVGLAVLAGMVSAVIFGVAPMVAAWRRDLMAGLRRSGAGDPGGRVLGTGGVFIGAQFFVATALLIAATLGARSYWVMARGASVFDAEQVLVASIALSGQGYESRIPQEQYFDGVLRTLRTTSHVRAVGLDAGSLTGPIVIDQLADSDRSQVATIRPVSEGFLPAIGARLVSGHWPRAGVLDVRDPESNDALLVNRAFARMLPPGRDPVGLHVRGAFVSGTIAGVIDDFNDWRLDATPGPQVFVPFKRAMTLRSARVAIRVDGDPEALASILRQRVSSGDRSQAVADFAILDNVLAASVMPRRFQIALFAAFASLAVVLALTGIFGLVAHGVGQRAGEIAIRLALGARRHQVVAAAVARQLGFAIGGVVAGALAMLAATPLLAPLVDQVSPSDPVSFIGAVSLLGASSIAIAIGAAARIASVSPMTSLEG